MFIDTILVDEGDSATLKHIRKCPCYMILRLFLVSSADLDKAHISI